MVRNGVLDVYIKDMQDDKLTKLQGLSRKESWVFGRSSPETPDIYFVSGTSIVIYAVPGESEASDTLIVKYADVPSALILIRQ